MTPKNEDSRSFSIIEFQNLVKLEQKLEEKKPLSTQEEAALEKLLDYEINILHNKYREQKSIYKELFQDFLNGSISPYCFCDTVNSLRRDVMTATDLDDSINYIQPQKNAENVYVLANKTFYLCEKLDDNLDEELIEKLNKELIQNSNEKLGTEWDASNTEFNPIWFKEEMNKIFLEMKKYLD